MRPVGKWLAVLAVAVVLSGCAASQGEEPAGEAGGRLVVTSIYPMYEFTRAVAGDWAEVINLVPPGAEPHDWEPSPGDIRRLNQAAVFVYSGAGMEHWVEKTLASLDNPDLIVVEASRGVDLLAADEPEDGDGAGAGERPDAAHDHGQWDPHVWLDPKAAAQQVEAIRDALIEADPEHQAEYEANAAQYISELEALDEELQRGLAICARREVFTTHAAFGYLARAYNLKQHAIMGLTPEAEPAPQEFAAVVAEARELGVKHIFFESLTSDEVARVVAGEIGAETLVLNPFEGLTEEEIAAGENYLSVMRSNLANLQKALECGK